MDSTRGHCLHCIVLWEIDWQCITKNMASTHGLLINSPGWVVHSMQVPVLGKVFIPHLGCLIRPDTVSDCKLSTMELWRLRDNASRSLVPRPEISVPLQILLGMRGLRICFQILNLNPWTLGCTMCFNEPPPPWDLCVSTGERLFLNYVCYFRKFPWSKIVDEVEVFEFNFW